MDGEKQGSDKQLHELADGVSEMDDRIERYLTGRMPVESAEQFEIQLLSDPELLAETRAAESLQRGLRTLAAAEGDAVLEPQVGSLAVAAVIALSITVGLLMDRGQGSGMASISGAGSMVAELSLTRGGAGPVITLAPGTSQLVLRLDVPGVQLAERPWILDASSVGGSVAYGLEGSAATVVLDATTLADGDHRIVVVGTTAGDLSFHFTTVR
jgi:hypothetical protein